MWTQVFWIAVILAGLVGWFVLHVRTVEGFDAPPPDPNTFVIEDTTTQFPEEIKSHVVFRGTADKELALPSANSVTDQSLVFLNATKEARLTLVPASGSVFQNGDAKVVVDPQETITLHCNGTHWAIVGEMREQEPAPKRTDGSEFRARGRAKARHTK